MELIIDSEFKGIIPPLSDDEFNGLKQSILTEGCRDAIVTWNGIIIDGHNRYAICTKHGIPFKTEEKQFDDRLDVKIWMVKNQFGRRNLENFVKASLALKLKEFFKEKADKNKKIAGKTYGVNHPKEVPLISAEPLQSNEIHPIDTREELAKVAGVGHDTISKVEEIQKATPVEVKDILEKKLSDGDLSINQVHKAVKSVKNDKNAGKILEKALEKTEASPKILFENAVKEAKQEAELEEKENKREEALIQDTKPVIKKSLFNFTTDSIEWAKWTWNPVTGCKFGCKYCYARDIANRFYKTKFEPTFHEDRMDAPLETVVPKEAITDIGYKNVFVCSMADLFGDWIPDEWIKKVLKAVRENPQWNYLFLSKNPKRLIGIDFPDNAWVGTTVDVQKRVDPAKEAFRQVKAKVKFLSCEPLQENVIFDDMSMFDWLIIGGRSESTGMLAGQPEWKWVEDLLIQARKDNVSLYFKPNLEVRPTEYPQKYEQAEDLTQSEEGDSCKLYTIGYEGKDIQTFIEILKNNGIEYILDVRDTPRTRNNADFNKNRINDILKREGIEYTSKKELGVVKGIRDLYKKGEMLTPEFEQKYYEKISTVDMNELAREIKLSGCTALMCYEMFAIATGKQKINCHRSILANILKTTGEFDEIINL
jgi:Bacteriophage protein gp37